ncbi:uncharacterized protein [Watersipora subatra]|uniref:uncharacterized protein n=1 Tax=Watersipora subatra TaxID=2589382 RepID=UPI00355B473A
MDVIDFLTCGGCQAEFPLSKITIFMEHKRTDCNFALPSNRPEYTFNNYECYTCPERFGAAVSLLLHVQFYHKRKIFQESAGSRTDHPYPDTSQAISSLQENSELAVAEVKEADTYPAVEVTEPLSKCCTSIIPKKRKRHFETKHKTSFFKTARYRRQHQSLPSNGISNGIFIDVDPPHSDMIEYETKVEKTQEHSAFLPVGRTVTIPINNRSREGDYVGISYEGSEQNGSTTYQNSSNLYSTKTASSSFTPNIIPSSKEVSQSEAPLAVKKKYPTSKPFKCNNCDDSFNQKVHLKKHQSKHTGVKPFKCDHCNYSTVERSHLRVHIRVHTGEKPFKCSHCEYSTAQNSTLKIHLKRHHGGAMSLECTHCGKHFPERTQLMFHKQEHGQEGNNEQLSPAANNAQNDMLPSASTSQSHQ